MSPPASSGRNGLVRTSALRLTLRRWTRRGRRSAPSLPGSWCQGARARSVAALQDPKGFGVACRLWHTPPIMPANVTSQWDFGELFPPAATRRVFTVTELTTTIRRLLEKEVGAVWIT